MHRRLQIIAQFLTPLIQQPLVHLTLHFGDRANQVHLHLWRQVLAHLVLLTAQQKGRDLLAQGLLQALTRTGIGRDRGLFEASAGAQQAGHNKTEQSPYIEQAILNRRTSQRETTHRTNRTTGLRHLRLGVLDLLRLIEHRIAKLSTLKQMLMPPQLRVTGNPQLRLLPGRGLKSLSTAQHRGL